MVHKLNCPICEYERLIEAAEFLLNDTNISMLVNKEVLFAKLLEAKLKANIELKSYENLN